MGVLCSKAGELEKNENERSMGFPVDGRQTTKKTASRPAHRHSLLRQAGASTQRLKRRSVLQNRSSFLFQMYFFNKGHLQSMQALAHFVTELVSPMGSFSAEI